MRTKEEIDELLKVLDEELQKNVGDFDMPEQALRLAWSMRTTLLWVKGELENLK